MGCASSRDLGEEERYIMFAEEGLRFHKLDAIDIDSAFRKYNNKGFITQSQLIYLSETLEFLILNCGPHGHIQNFFHSIATKEGTYDMKDILLVAILLSKGKSSIKAKLIYEIFDPCFTHQIDINEVKSEILFRMIDHSSRTLFNLVCSEMVKIETEGKIYKYKRKLKDSFEIALNDLASRLTIRGNIISQDTFVEVFSSYNNGELVTPTGIRKYLLMLRSTNASTRNSHSKNHSNSIYETS